MVAEVCQADRGDVALDLGSLTELQPAFLREQSQQDAIGSPESDGFTNPLAGESGFDLSAHSGNLDAVQTAVCGWLSGFCCGAFRGKISLAWLPRLVSLVMRCWTWGPSINWPAGEATKRNLELSASRW
jgi:hypothetical protein